MVNLPKHLLFYDGQCGLCDQIVEFIYNADIHQQFAFAPLNGETAKILLQNLSVDQTPDSLILIENYKKPTAQFFILGKGALRIFWLLGGYWVLIGWISFLPSWLYDWIYRLIARNRHRLFPQSCSLQDKDNERFLP